MNILTPRTGEPELEEGAIVARSEDESTCEGESSESAPRGAFSLALVVIFLMLFSAVFTWEPWPFTSFRLFSQNRTAAQGSWETVAKFRDGSVTSVAIDQLPNGFRGFSFTMNTFETLSAGDRQAACGAWLEGVEENRRREVQSLTISRRSWSLAEGDTRTDGFEETVSHVCTGDQAISRR